MGSRIGFGYGGILNFWEEGARAFFRAEMPLDCSYIYKIWIGGHGGNELLLGTLSPEGNCLRLFRTMSISQLRSAGCWPVTAARAKRTPISQRKEPFWYREPHPEVLIPLLKEKKSGVGEMMCHKEKERTQLAVPVNEHRALALDFLFCFAVTRQIGGRWHLVWEFDQNGMPVLPQGS